MSIVQAVRDVFAGHLDGCSTIIFAPRRSDDGPFYGQLPLVLGKHDPTRSATLSAAAVMSWHNTKRYSHYLNQATDTPCM